MLYKETVSTVLLNNLQRLLSFHELNEFVLVGGTALSLQIGHRRSIDIDLFTAGVFPAETLPDFLRENGFSFHQQNRFKGGLLGHIDNIKVDFICHAYPWVRPPQVIEGIRLASLEDIAAMKLNAITGNGTRLKDFVDIAYLSAYMNLSSMLDWYEQKYPDVNGTMALKSICYFNEIDFSAGIDYTDNGMNWEIIEKRLLNMVREPGKQFPVL